MAMRGAEDGWVCTRASYPDLPMNRIVPLILAVALFMEQMDSTVISTSLPAIAADLGVGPITLKLALTAYMVSLATFIPLSGWMADRFGAKRVFRLAILVFVAGSIFCAVSARRPDRTPEMWLVWVTTTRTP